MGTTDQPATCSKRGCRKLYNAAFFGNPKNLCDDCRTEAHDNEEK